MCGMCNVPGCDCPKASDSIAMCGCEKGIRCEVCGHDPMGGSTADAEQGESTEA